MNKFMIFCILLLIGKQSCYSQSKNNISLFNDFKNDVQIEQKKFSGVVKMDDETAMSYYLLIKNSSFSDLVKYTNDSNGFVRSHVFFGLLQKKINNKVLRGIVNKHKEDTAKFITKSSVGDITWRVNDFMNTGMKLRTEKKLRKINFGKRIAKLRNKALFVIRVEGIHHGLIEKDNLLKMDTLILKENPFKIASYTLFIGKEIFKGYSNIVTNEMKTAIKDAASGTSLYFTDIKVVIEDKTLKAIDEFSIKLK